jgi:hypothetical protein
MSKYEHPACPTEACSRMFMGEGIATDKKITTDI